MIVLSNFLSSNYIPLDIVNSHTYSGVGIIGIISVSRAFLCLLKLLKKKLVQVITIMTQFAKRKNQVPTPKSRSNLKNSTFSCPIRNLKLLKSF